MLRAVFVRTLKPGVTYEQYVHAWAPETAGGGYPVVASVSRNVANDRQVVTILELDATLEEFAAIRATLTRPDAKDQLQLIVETTEVEGVYEEVLNQAAL